jgi:hypothetical protein
MTKLFNLDFHGSKFTVPRRSLSNLFEHQRDLREATSYRVQSSVPLGIFEIFVHALQTGTTIPVTKENAGEITLLAKEFWVEDSLADSPPVPVSPIPEPTKAESPVPLVSPSKPLKDAKFPPADAGSDEGVISYLTGKYGGNVHDKYVIYITTKSPADDDSIHGVRHVADLTSDVEYISKNAPDQWICWHFYKRRIRPTRYAIRGYLKSWVLESSLNGEKWVEIDRRPDNHDLAFAPNMASFAVSNSGPCHFIRLTQTDKNHKGNNSLIIFAFEVFETLPAPVSTPSASGSPSKSLKEITFPLKEDKSLDGMISYLTREHRGNVHDNEIVTITSKSIWSGAQRNVADLNNEKDFCSKDEPGQWVSWDFHEMRISPTHYTVRGSLKSWVVESSLEGVNWVEIHRETDGRGDGSFAVSNSVECRFVRLTQTSKNSYGSNCLAIYAFEIFGTLKSPSSPPVCRPTAVPADRHSNAPEEDTFPLNEDKSFDGIISYLTEEYNGNVHNKGIVTISASDMNNKLDSTRTNVLDFTSTSHFESTNTPNQWICWDFHEMRVRPTHYTIQGLLKSLVVESSLDGVAWTEMDRKKHDKNLKKLPHLASFDIAKRAECRFIRLTQTGKNREGNNRLIVEAFEIFGTLKWTLSTPVCTSTAVSSNCPSTSPSRPAFRLARPNNLMESFPILLGNTGEMFTIKELSQLLQSRFFLIVLCGMSLISLLTRISAQRTSQASGFAGISAKCASARLITQSKVSL